MHNGACGGRTTTWRLFPRVKACAVSCCLSSFSSEKTFSIKLSCCCWVLRDSSPSQLMCVWSTAGTGVSFPKKKKKENLSCLFFFLGLLHFYAFLLFQLCFSTAFGVFSGAFVVFFVFRSAVSFAFFFFIWRCACVRKRGMQSSQK